MKARRPAGPGSLSGDRSTPDTRYKTRAIFQDFTRQRNKLPGKIQLV
jgi:hypothetical protein